MDWRGSGNGGMEAHLEWQNITKKRQTDRESQTFRELTGEARRDAHM